MRCIRFWRMMMVGVALGTLVSCAKSPPSPPRPTMSPSAAPDRSAAPAPVSSEFTGDRAMQHVRYLVEKIGPRPARSAALEQAGDYVIASLEQAGYVAEKLPYVLPGGQTALNVSAVKAGRSEEEIVLAAHLDTVPKTPGANDDASGIGTLLELAEILQELEIPRSVRFLFLTAEESIEEVANEAGTLPGFEEHGYSSLRYFEHLEADPPPLPQIAAACWMDKIAAGPRFKVIFIKDTRPHLARHLHELATRQGMDPKLVAAKRWSEEMVFEDRGIPTAWIEYGPAPHLHRPGDDLSNVEPEKLAAVGALVYRWIMEEPQP